MATAIDRNGTRAPRSGIDRTTPAAAPQDAAPGRDKAGRAERTAEPAPPHADITQVVRRFRRGRWTVTVLPV